MNVLTFGSGRPRGLILAGVHGDEYEPILAARRLAETLATMPLKGSVQIVPLVNESAFAARARCGQDGLDLARTFPGRADGSLTERIAHEVSALIHEADFLIDLHTGGIALQLTPLSGYMLHADENILEKQRAMARAFNMPLVWGSSPSLEGRTLSVARDANTPAIYAEWGGGAPVDSAGVENYFQSCLNVLGLWEMMDRAPGVPRVQFVVEEAHETSGDLLLAHHAPFAGFFDCRVGLNQTVQTGDVLGEVFEPGGAQRETIYAENSGLVICLRAVASVQKGDSLAMILETTHD
jgi:predicted deacylase